MIGGIGVLSSDIAQYRCHWSRFSYIYPSEPQKQYRLQSTKKGRGTRTTSILTTMPRHPWYLDLVITLQENYIIRAINYCTIKK